MPGSGGDAGPVAGWPFLVAAGRRRDYSTLLAPDFLVEALDYGVLGHTVRPTANGRSEVTLVRTAAGRALTVVYATHLLTAVDLGSVGAPPRDELNRPLRLVYGFVVADGWLTEPAAADLDHARATALATYRRFLSDEDGATVAGSAAFGVRSVVQPRKSPQWTLPGPVGLGPSPGRTIAMVSAVLAAAVVAVTAVLVIGHRVANPIGDPCPTTTVVVTPTPAVTCPPTSRR